MTSRAASFRHLPMFFAGMLLVLLALLHAGFPPFSSLFERLEFANLDLFFKLRGSLSPGENLVIVAIDDAGFQSYGAWPWPRQRIAALVQRLAEAKAELIVCDFILHDKPEDSAGTAALVQAIKAAQKAGGRNRVLLPYYFSEFTPALQSPKTVLPGPIAASALILFDAPHAMAGLPILNATALFHSTEDLIAVSLPGGHINILAEGETVRWENQIIRYGDLYLPSLPLQTAIHARRLTRGEVMVQAGAGVQAGKLFVPMDAQARSLINYYGPEETFPKISVTEVFAADVAARVKNKIVFIGVTAAGTQDFLRTSTSARLPGVEKLATSTANILNRETLVRQSGMLATELLVMLVLGVIAFWVGKKWPQAYAGAALFGLALALWVAAFGFFVSSDLWFRPMGLIISTCLLGILGIRGRISKIEQAGASSLDVTRFEDMPRRIARFEIIREIGEGAMGKIYEGHDPTINRRAAIKTIRPLPGLSASSNKRMRQRFLHEAQAAGALNHPNIVTIYQADEAGPYSYIAMEYLEGKTFEEVIEREAPLACKKIAQLLIPVCEALAYAHERGVVHRDVKPANIMLTREGLIKLMDFGIAHIFASSLTQEGALLGTPNYMSPEQIRGEKVDGRSDIFSVGIVAYEMATRSHPFVGESMATISHRIVSGTVIPPSELNTKLPEGFEEVILRALRKDRATRYASAKELAVALAGL